MYSSNFRWHKVQVPPKVSQLCLKIMASWELFAADSANWQLFFPPEEGTSS